MLLVLGRPGAGCSSLLKVLSNNVESFTSVDGAISYDGLSPNEMASSHSGDIAYLPEVRLSISLEFRLRFDFA
jgi:ATP-binding cassette subfamily G (WHITE) protein 2 (SNQ2)